MFPFTEDPSATPKAWRTELRRVAGLVIAFVTLDGYGPLASAFDSADELSCDLLHAHARNRRPLPAQPRRRGHGSPPAGSSVCISGPTARRSPNAAQQRSAHAT